MAVWCRPLKPYKKWNREIRFCLKKILFSWLVNSVLIPVFHLFQCLVIFSHLFLYKHIIMRTDLRCCNDSLLSFGLKCKASLTRFEDHEFPHFSDPQLKRYWYKNDTRPNLASIHLFQKLEKWRKSNYTYVGNLVFNA